MTDEERITLHAISHLVTDLLAGGDHRRSELNQACTAFLAASSLRVIDPAKVMVLERHDETPKEEGMYLNNIKGMDYYLTGLGYQQSEFEAAKKRGWSLVAFGPIQLPPTEGR